MTTTFGKITPVGHNVYKAGEPVLIDYSTRDKLTGDDLDGWADAYGFSAEYIDAFRDYLGASGDRKGRGEGRNDRNNYPQGGRNGDRGSRNKDEKRGGDTSTIMLIEDGANKYVQIVKSNGYYEQYTPCSSACTLPAPVEEAEE